MNNPTESDKIKQSENFIRLNTKQRQAIEMLLMGKTDLEVTESLGIVRDTLWRWRTQNHDFIAVWNELSVQVWTDLTSRLNDVFSRSVEVIEEAVDRRDVDVAIALVQTLKENVNKEQRNIALQPIVLNNLLFRSIGVIEEALRKEDTEVAIALLQGVTGNVNTLQGNTTPQLVVLKAGVDRAYQKASANVNHHPYPAS